MTVYIAFPVSEKLDAAQQALSAAVASNPQALHQVQIDQLSEAFITEVLNAFFDQPIQTLRIRGNMASIMNSVVSIIGKASRALVGRVFKKISLDEQTQLTRHFEQMHLVHEGQTFCGFALSAEQAATVTGMFAAAREERVEGKQMADAMLIIVEGAISHFFDQTVAKVKLGMINRGLVATSRATIHTAAASAVNRNLPTLEAKLRKPLMGYFETLVIEA